jgi:hypothetical protein
LYFYFSGLSLRKAAEADDGLASYVLLNETVYLYGTDGIRNTGLTENLLLSSTKRRRRIEEFIVLMMRP